MARETATLTVAPGPKSLSARVHKIAKEHRIPVKVLNLLFIKNAVEEVESGALKINKATIGR